jgi:hypothetical protein
MAIATRLSAAAARASLLLALVCAAPPAAAQHEGHGRSRDDNAATKSETNAAAAADEGATFVCPMHPEVVSKTEGSCPKCGMRLREKVAEAKDSPAPPATPRAADGTKKLSIPDVELLDQDGRKVRFYTDLVRGRTVAVNFIFTT